MKDENKNQDQDEEVYQAFLAEAKQDFSQTYTVADEGQKTIVKTGRYQAQLTTIMVSLAIILLILPIMTLLTYMYYGYKGKADQLIDIAAKTIYVTEPNTNLKPMEIEDEIGLFSMRIMFDVYKRIGSEDYKAADYNIYFALDNPSFPKKNYLLDRPLPEIPEPETETLLHPKAPIQFNQKEEWDILNGLPDGSVAEVYVSLANLQAVENVKKIFSNDIEIRWIAVDTGVEARQTDKEGVPIAPLGYPAQTDSTTWSPFNGNEGTNDKVFVDILSLLAKHEAVAEKVARAKSLELKERLTYVKENGLNVYGVVITGPTTELRKLEQKKEIRALKVGEVKLWNWK